MTGELALQTLSDDCEDLLHEAYLLIEAGDWSGAEVDLPSLISQIEQCADRCASLDVAFDFGELRTKLLFYHSELLRLWS